MLDTIPSPHEDRTRILIGVGTNDIKYGQPLGYMKNTLSQIIREAQNTYPRANIHVCGLPLSNNLDMDKIRHVNEVYEDVCCKTQHVKFIDTYIQLFQYNYRDVTTDGTHLNNKGVDILKYTISEGVK